MFQRFIMLMQRKAPARPSSKQS